MVEVVTEHMLTRNARVEQDVIDQLFNSSEKPPADAASSRPLRRRTPLNVTPGILARFA
jgi:hypothetical protein